MSADGSTSQDNDPTAQDIGNSSQTTTTSSQASGSSSQASGSLSQASVTSSHANETPSQGKKLPKDWKLEGGTMAVIGHGKKRPKDVSMTLELEFKFDNEKKPRLVEMPYNDPYFKGALIHCNTHLDTFLYLEDFQLETVKYFPEFMNQEVMKYQQRLNAQDPEDRDERPKREYSRITIERLDGKYYMMGTEVYNLTDGTCLTKEEMRGLPVQVKYTGPEFKYSNDEKEAYTLLMHIIGNGNKMQDPEYLSFALASFTSHLCGKIYPLIIAAQSQYSMQMNVSGSATGTGKSFWQSVWMAVFEGEVKTTLNGITEAQAYQRLASGENIYVKEFSAKKQPARSTQIDIKFLKWAIATLWECSGKGSGTKADGSVIKPAAVVHIDANLLPEDIIDDLGLPMASKMKFLYTGETPMQHPDDTDLIAETLGDLAPQLHVYLPVLYRLAILAILPVVPRSYYESEELEDVLAKPGDKREGQLLFQYDNIYLTCKKMISKYDLDAPPLFLFDGIDRRALVKLNKKIENKDDLEEMTTGILDSVKSQKLQRVLEYSGRKSYKIPVNAFPQFPDHIASDLKSLKKVSSTFAGRRGQKVVFLYEANMDDDARKEIQLIVNSRYHKWISQVQELKDKERSLYGEQVYSRFSTSTGTSSTNSENLLVDCADALEEEDIEESDGPFDELEEDLEAPSDKKFKCTKEGCKGRGRTFKYTSEWIKHEGLKYHKNA